MTSFMKMTISMKTLNVSSPEQIFSFEILKLTVSLIYVEEIKVFFKWIFIIQFNKVDFLS